ncbi:Twinfilin-1 [Trichinella nelsoni]|uniref:Twinfilin n=1 Tax=Trichinella nelsoni TaxID=6336 RepID=A0A0V0SNB1_9BILA|nr:Twinfilin-1 [Trichinella nelsoni]
MSVNYSKQRLLKIASTELVQFFTSCKEGNIRLAKIKIQDEKLILACQFAVRSTWDKDYESYIEECLADEHACYILARLDTQPTSGFDWLFLSYISENAPVKEKMLYASTKATLKGEFGSGSVKYDFQVTQREEMDLHSLQRLINQKDAGGGPLTELEEQMKSTHVNQHCVNSFPGYETAVVRGVRFPVDQDALQNLCRLRDGEINYVQLSIDTLNEVIKLVTADNIPSNRISKWIPPKSPRYHFYAPKLTKAANVIIFIYSIPPNGCTVKERMLYSSCKGPFLDTVQQVVGLKVDRKIEIDSSEDVNDEFLIGEDISVKQHQKFSRPKGPKKQRGDPRIHKTPS